MARSATLKPTKVNSRKAQGLHAWCLNVPPALAENGKRQRLFFATEKDAAAEVEKLKARKDNFGLSLTTMTPARIALASEAFKLLDPVNIDLLDAVRGYLDAHNQRTASIPFTDLFNAYLDAKHDRNPEYLRELRITRDRMPEFHAKLASEISHRDLEPFLNGMTPGARNPVMRYLRAVFRFGVKRGYLLEDPISRLDFADRPRKEVEIVTNGQVEAMLKHAAANDLQLLPFLVIGFFCGVRPDGELEKLLWSDIDLNDKIVTIRPAVSKTKRRRFVDLSNNAKSWLQLFIQRAGIQQGPIVTYNHSELRTHRATNWKAAGIQSWLQQGMRHTYCSNWLAKHNDINKLVLQSGHDSVDTMWRNYHRGTPAAEAKKFWAIRPKAGTRNIIAFTKAA